MIWYAVEEEFPLDTLNRPSLWLWDGKEVLQGGFVEPSLSKKRAGYWFDLNFQPLRGVTHWREIMPEDVEGPEPPSASDLSDTFPQPRGKGI